MAVGVSEGVACSRTGCNHNKSMCRCNCAVQVMDAITRHLDLGLGQRVYAVPGICHLLCVCVDMP